MHDRLTRLFHQQQSEQAETADAGASDSAAGGDGVGGGCPHVDRNDHRCGHRFSLGRLDQAMCVCFGSFHACPMFHRLNGEARLRPDQSLGRDAAPSITPALVPVTVHARSLTLRPTGT